MHNPHNIDWALIQYIAIVAASVRIYFVGKQIFSRQS